MSRLQPPVLSNAPNQPRVNLDDRDSIIAWLCWNDRNGTYTDADSKLHGMDPMTLAEAQGKYIDMTYESRRENYHAMRIIVAADFLLRHDYEKGSLAYWVKAREADLIAEYDRVIEKGLGAPTD